MTGRPTVALMVGSVCALPSTGQTKTTAAKSDSVCVRHRPRLLGWLRLTRAFVASSIENDFVIFDAEISRSHFFNSFQTFLELEDTAADPAQKMVMMALVGTLVTRGFARDLDGDDASVRRKGLE